MPYKYLGAPEKTANISSEQPISGTYKYLGSEEPKKKSSFLERGTLPYIIKHPEEATEAVRTIGRTAKSSAVGTIGSALDLKNMLRDLATSGINKLTGKDASEFMKIISGPDIGSKNIRESIEKGIPSLKPRTPGEQKYEEAVELGSSLANPLMGEANIGRATIGTALGLGAKEGAKYLGAGEKGQEIAKNISAVLPLVLKGSIRPTTSEAKQLYDAGTRAELTEQQLAPLLVENWKLSSLGKFAKQSPAITRRMNDVESTLGNFFNTTKQKASELLPYSPQQSESLAKDMEKISSSWKNTLKAAPDKETAIKFVDEGIDKLRSEGTNPEALVNFYQDINSAVNWRAIKGGKKQLSEVKNLILNHLNRSSPEMAKDFESANKLWSKLEDFRSKVGWGNLENYVKLGEYAPILYGIGTFDPMMIGKGGLALLSTEGARRIATELLTNPSWQHITKTSIQAAVRQSPKIAALAYNEFKDKVKEEFPEEYEQIEWSK